MRRLPILAGVTLVLVAAGATMAASPAPSASPGPKAAAPAASPAPSAAPATPKAGSSSTQAAGQTWSAAIRPLDVTTGSAQVVEAANGTGTITLHLNGLRADAPWSVDVDGGTIAKATEATRDEIAFRSGVGVEKTSSDTVRIHLTAAEMKAFIRDRSAMGVVILVSDGANRSAATFSAG